MVDNQVLGCPSAIFFVNSFVLPNIPVWLMFVLDPASSFQCHHKYILTLGLRKRTMDYSLPQQAKKVEITFFVCLRLRQRNPLRKLPVGSEVTDIALSRIIYENCFYSPADPQLGSFAYKLFCYVNLGMV